MQKLFSCFLVLFLLFAAVSPVCAESVLPAEDPVPVGIWTLSDAGWYFSLNAELTLSAEQTQRFADAGLPAPLSYSPGYRLSLEEYKFLYPHEVLFFEQEDFFAGVSQPAETEVPALKMFEMDGSWFYREDGVLCYDPGHGYAVMTKDEVFAALYPDAAPTASEEKILYLTIDDAPSKYTMELLATLRALNIRATFFVTGTNVRAYPTFLKAIYEEGHIIANHSFSHNASILSSSVSACMADFDRCQAAVNEALGFEYPMNIARFPYGASTPSPASRTALQEKGYLWLDWNCLNGDTEDQINSDQDAYNRAVNTARGHDTVVMLVHDGKKRTIRTLPALAEYFRGEGYTFRVVTLDIGPVDGVRMGFPITE